jgi:hypothetical protein
MMLMDEAAKGGVDRLNGFWESNSAILDVLAATGNLELVAQLAKRFDMALQKLREGAAAGPKALADVARGPAQTTQSQDDGWPGPEVSDRAQQQEQLDPDRGSLAIAPVLSQGKEDWRTWTVALFGPKLRKIKDGRTLAFFLGDNEPHLAKARGSLAKADLTELEQAIAQQQRVCDQAMLGAASG